MGTFFGGGSASPSPERYAGIQVSTSMMGQVIPYVAGRNRVPMNLLWYGDFTSSPNSSGGKSGSPPSSYTYSASFIGALALGPIQANTQNLQIWQDKSLVTYTYENLALALGSCAFVGGISGTTLTVSKIIGGSIELGPMQGPGVAAGTTITAGSGTSWTVSPSQTVASGTVMRCAQGTWAGYPSGTPSGQEIPYDGIAYVASQEYIFGTTASMPDLTFEIEGCVPGWDDAGAVYDADPSAIIVDYLTDPVHGAAFQGTIDLTTLQGASNTYQAYCGSIAVALSPLEDNQRSATDFMQEIMQCTNSDFVLTCGTLRVVPYADTAVSGTYAGTSWSYSPDLTPVYIFTDSDFCPKKGEEPVKLTRKPTTDTYNIVNLTYYDRANYYNPAPASASNNADISIRGPKAMSTLDFQEVTTASVAKTVAQLILQFQLYERNTYEFRVRSDYCLLEPMDYIAINDPVTAEGTGLGLVNQVCRITEVDEDEEGFFTVKCMEVPGTVRNTPQYNWNSSQGYYANFANAPLSVATPAIFVMPPISAALSAALTVGVAVCGQTSDTNWGGCQVWCSLDGGSTYDQVGTVGQVGPGRYGSITANIGAVPDPDTTSTLSVALTNTNEQLSTTVTHADADGMETLILVGSGSDAEVMAYGTAALVSAGNYNLTYLRRGLYGSDDLSHSSGALFVRLDGAIFQLPLDSGSAGQTIYFKFLSFNTVGKAVQSLSAATAYSYTIPTAWNTGGSMALVPRGSCAIGTGPATDGSNTIVYKSTAGSSAWDSDCYLPSPFGAGQIRGVYAQGELALCLATSVSSVLNPTTSSVPYCLEVNSSGDWIIAESGTTVATLAAAEKGDVALLAYDGYFVYYWLNGTLERETAALGLSLYADFAMYSPGATLSNCSATAQAEATPQLWKSSVPASLTVNDVGVTKASGAAAGWNVAAVSVLSFPICTIQGKLNAAADNVFIALVSAADATALANYPSGSGNAYQLLDYGLDANSSGYQIYNLGTEVNVPSTAAAKTSDVFTITYNGSAVDYYLNGNQVYSQSVSGLTLYGAVLVYTPGGGINSLEFIPGATPPTVSPAGGQIAGNGSITPNILSESFSYTSTTSSIDISWSAATIYRSDGTTTAIAAGSTGNVTGLSSGTSYTVYPYYDEMTEIITFAEGFSGASGTPAVCYAVTSPTAAAEMLNQGNIPLNAFLVATTSSGTGGGGGGGFGCLHPEQSVRLADEREICASELVAGDELPTPAGPKRITRVGRRACAVWHAVTVRGHRSGERTVRVDAEHRFVRPDSSAVRARELTLGAILAAADEHLEVMGLKLEREVCDRVQLELEAPHLYYLAGVLCHNLKP